MHQILSTQNSENNIKLLRASSVAYLKAKKAEIKITFFLIFLSFAYPITYIFLKNEIVKLSLFGCSFFITVVIQLLSPTFKGNTSTGAILKEEFDRTLFNIKWKATLKKPDFSEISKLSNLYNGPSISDWYSFNISKKIPTNTAIAILQYSNTIWDIELRKIYRKWLVYYLFFYTILLISILVINNIDSVKTFLLFFSLLSFYIHFLNMIQAHTTVIKKRKNISKCLNDIICNKINVGIDELRDYQDEIYLTRLESAKVPNFFFHWFQKKIDTDVEEYIIHINKLYA